MAVTSFVSSTAGRALRIIAGLALIVIGLAVVGPLLGTDLHGDPKITEDHERSTR